MNNKSVAAIGKPLVNPTKNPPGMIMQFSLKTHKRSEFISHLKIGVIVLIELSKAAT